MKIDYSQVEALFFDFDGTLVNSLPALKKLYESFMKACGKEPSDEEFDDLNGRPLEDIQQLLIKRHQLGKGALAQYEDYKSKISAAYLEVEPMPAVQDYLNWAKAQNFKLWVVTSAPYPLAYCVLEKLKLLPFFEEIITSEGLSEGKPHPAIYKRALDVAKVDKEKVLVFEDAEHGINSAQAAGCSVIEMQPLQSANPHHCPPHHTWHSLLSISQ